MNRFPHQILIQKPDENFNDPWNDTYFTTAYEGRCRCFINGQSRFRSNKVMDADFHIVIPDPHMVSIGENWKANISYEMNNKTSYDVIGYVRDFVRYDKVCEVFIQVIKENQIAGDVPSGR